MDYEAINVCKSWEVLAVHAAVCANIQAPYPTTRSRTPAVSPELHNASR